MATYIFDLECDGFLEEASVIHSLVLKDVDTGEVFSGHASSLSTGITDNIKRLMTSDRIIGHNVIRFDVPVIKKLFPWFHIDEDKVRDTLVCTRLIWTNLYEQDMKRGGYGKLTGSHSLAAWGQRIGDFKGDFKGPWDTWTQEMQDYCVQDVEVTHKLWKLIESKNYSEQAIDLEHRVAWIIALQERNGFLFDTTGAAKLYATLVKRRVELEDSLQTTFAPWWSGGETKTPSKTITYKDPLKADRVAGAPFQEVTYNLFNPGSRHHIADRLHTMRGWKPTEFTEKGQPKVDEEVLGKLPYPEAKLLSEYFLVEKRIGQIADGDQAWLKQVKADGRIHGSVNTNGAVTGRATHSNPNMAQVPAIGVPYGGDCRALFKVPKGKKLVGIDVSGLELRMLGHYMAKHDAGVYAKEVINGDIHTANQQAAGLATRNEAKRFIYAFLYGAGPEKIANVTGKKSRAAGLKIKSQFLAKTPALKALIDGVQGVAEKRGCLTGLDGRLLHIRSPHAALNTLLQSAGALVCKQWIVELHKLLADEGLDHTVRQVAWIHDEIQLEVDEDLAEVIGKHAVDAIRKAGIVFNLRVPLDGEYKIGNNWKETH